jgi:hypothetical protein
VFITCCILSFRSDLKTICTPKTAPTGFTKKRKTRKTDRFLVKKKSKFEISELKIKNRVIFQFTEEFLAGFFSLSLDFSSFCFFISQNLIFYCNQPVFGEKKPNQASFVGFHGSFRQYLNPCSVKK